MPQPDYSHEAELMRIAAEAAHEAQDAVIADLGKIVVDSATEIITSTNAAEQQYAKRGIDTVEEYANADTAAESVDDYLLGPASIAHAAERYLQVNEAARKMGRASEFVDRPTSAGLEQKPFIDEVKANELGMQNQSPKRPGRNQL